MADYFVSASRGDDSTGSGSATNPWKTIGKAVGASPAITLSGSGDVVWLEPGIYREVVTLGLSPTSGGPLTIAGDGDGAAFAAGGYTTPATGLVDWRGWSDDATGITSQATFVAGSKSYVTLKGLKIIGSNTSTASSSCLYLLGSSWSNWTIQDCIFVGSSANGTCVWATRTDAAAMNITFDRVDFCGSGYGIDFRLPLNSSEYSLGAVLRNCRFWTGPAAIRWVNVGGSGASFATGLAVQSCSAFGATVFILVSATPALTTPIGVYGCKAINCTTGLSAATAGQIVEDGNVLCCTTPRNANVSAGAHSIAGVCPAFNVNDERLLGLPLRPFGEPSPVSPFVGVAGYGVVPSVDLFGRPRPDGYKVTTATAGAIERHDTGVPNATYADSGSDACLEIEGPGSRCRLVCFDAGSTQITVKVRWDGNHGDTNKPRAVLLRSPQYGLVKQTVTATSTGGSGSTPNSYETLTFTIAPTAAGACYLELQSRSGAANGKAYFDSIDVS